MTLNWYDTISRRGVVSLKLTCCVLFGPPAGLREAGTITLRARQLGLRLAICLPRSPLSERSLFLPVPWVLFCPPRFADLFYWTIVLFVFHYVRKYKYHFVSIGTMKRSLHFHTVVRDLRVILYFSHFLSDFHFFPTFCLLYLILLFVYLVHPSEK